VDLAFSVRPRACAGGAVWSASNYLYWLKIQRMKQFEQASKRSELPGVKGRARLKLVEACWGRSRRPIGIEFRRVFDEVSMGVALPQASRT
jgi:hypothetical protein